MHNLVQSGAFDYNIYILAIVHVLRQVYMTGQPFRGLNGPGIFYSTHAVRAHASAAAGMHVLNLVFFKVDGKTLV
jgi:hypothetical protein